jgi:hypothetical protein
LRAANASRGGFSRPVVAIIVGAVGAALVTWAVLIELTGGIDLRAFHVPISSRAARRPAIAGVALLLLHATFLRAEAERHGAPWKSGYGDVHSLYAWSNLPIIIVRYAGWLGETQTPLIAFGLIPLVLLRRVPAERRAPLLFLAAFTLATWLAYMFYEAFTAWWFVRFLLPAFPPMIVLALIGAVMLLRPVPALYSAAALTSVILVVFLAQMKFVELEKLTWSAWREAGYVSVGRHVERALPPAVASGSLQQAGDHTLRTWQRTSLTRPALRVTDPRITDH